MDADAVSTATFLDLPLIVTDLIIGYISFLDLPYLLQTSTYANVDLFFYGIWS